MPAYFTLVNFTDQGARSIKDSPQRFEAFKALAEGAGVTVKSAHWRRWVPTTLSWFRKASEDAVVALNLKTASLGQYADTCTAVLGVRYGASRSDSCMTAVSLL